MKKRRTARIIIQVCLALFFVTVIIAPIVTMFSRISLQSIKTVVASQNFGRAVVNSITTALTATVISMLLATAAAFSLCRSGIRLKSVYSMLFVLPMLIPSISHATGLKALIGNQGNGLLSFILGDKISIYGFPGIVAGSVLYSFPVAFLMAQTILQYEDGMPYKAAAVLGIPPFRRFTGITLPYMRKTLISMFFALFTMIITDYGVPAAITSTDFGETLSTVMFNYASELDLGRAGVIGVLLLIPAVVAFAVDMFVPETGQSGFVAEAAEEGKGRLSRILAYVFCTVLAVLILLPISASAIVAFAKAFPRDMTFTFGNIEKTMESGSDKFLMNSLICSAIAAVFGTLLAFISAYMTTRAKSGVTKALHLMSITSVAIPGLVLGLSYIIFFKNTPIYGTIFIIGLANTIHFFTSPYLMMYNTLGKVNPDLEAVGKTLGIKRIRIIIDVIVPKVRLTMYEMAVYFFVNSMMTISAVSLLAPPQMLSLMISQADTQSHTGEAAMVSVMILSINLAVKLIITVINAIKNKEKRVKVK
ncbi:MAG: ABC transporter permease subunit [Clostridia bacterium]|nr:ABC transporter permease subunit [Clostridia bacterium]